MFYLRLYGVGRIAKDYGNSQIGNPVQQLYWLLFLISCMIAHTMTLEIAKWVHHEGLSRRPILSCRDFYRDFLLVGNWLISVLVSCWKTILPVRVVVPRSMSVT